MVELTDKDVLLRKAVRLLNRYWRETPLGHQPHMIAAEAESLASSITAALAEKDDSGTCCYGASAGEECKGCAWYLPPLPKGDE